MKTKPIFLTIFLCILIGFQFAVERIKLEKPIEFHELLEKNNVFLGTCLSFDLADGYYYFLDKKYGTIFKVKENTGKLIKTISSKGQGPGEIQIGMNIRVRGNKIFVLDRGFNGIKIFDTEGKIIKEIKFTFGLGMANFDINEKDEIFLARFDTYNKKLISVYNLKGDKLRSLITAKNGDDVSRLSRNWYYYIRLDKTGNIYLLFYQDRKLAKYDRNGNFLWEKPVKNKILDKFTNRDELRGEGSTIHMTRALFSLDVTPKNNIVIGHVGGGCLFTADGNLKYEITDEGGRNLGYIKIMGDRLINLLVFGQIILIYPFKEE